MTPSTGPAITYVIDGQSRRIGKKVAGQLTRAWLWGGALAPVAELDGAGNLVSRFVYATHGNVPDYMLRDGATFRLVKDHLGSVRLVVNSNTGEVAQRLDYDSFGQVQLDTNPGFQPFGYAGGLYDPATGLVRFGVRDYDPQAGRWTTPDPIGYASGDTNLYAYAYNSPTNLRDPSGAVVPLIVGGVIVYNLFEAGMTVADLVDVYDKFTDPWADFWDKGISVGGAALGMALLGGSYGRSGKKLKELAEGAPRGGGRGADELGAIFVDPKGSAIPTPKGGSITGSPDGRFIQARDADGRPTGVRIDGPHNPAKHPDPRAQAPHGHVPGVTNPDGTPWLPIKE